MILVWWFQYQFKLSPWVKLCCNGAGAIVQSEVERERQRERGSGQAGDRTARQHAGSWKAGLGSHIVRSRGCQETGEGGRSCQETGDRGESEQWLAFIARSPATMSQLWTERARVRCEDSSVISVVLQKTIISITWEYDDDEYKY